MFTRAAGKPKNSLTSSSLDTIECLVQELDKSAALAEDKAQDPLDTLTSSLQAAYVTFGIFDSLTLAREKMSPNDSDDDYNGIFDSLTLVSGKMSPKDPDDDLNLEDDFEEEDGDEADFAGREFYSSWGNVVKAAPSLTLMRHDSTRRSGVRRGRQAVDSMGVIAVPTKFNDDNHKSDSRFHVSINKNRVVPKQSTPPAARPCHK
mmetsp:Transcript_23479/g.43206  ORF Transcript_23479/g.43206 Transcript_23479/m.43206 type:complete len:205 (+) Transcript_23479:80-694(+)